MKSTLSLLTLIAFALTLSACNTLANRRSLYSPKKGDGYWTRTLHTGTWRERGEKSADTTVRHGNAPAANAPVMPPPPPPPPTEPSTPLPESAPPAI